MESRNKKILVRVNHNQKSFFKIGDAEVMSANNYESNYREKSPTIAEVVNGNGVLNSGDVIICHHNLYYLPSPYHLYGEYFSIPFSKVIFARLNKDQSLTPVCGNILCDRVVKDFYLPLPPDKQEKYIDRVICTNPGDTDFKVGDLLFTRPHSYYEIVYVINGVKHKVHKCDSEMVCAVLV